MPKTENFAFLKKKPFTDAVNKFEELMTQSGRAFLLGAGCSKCAGLPLTVELTQKALKSKKLNTGSKEILAAMESNFSGAEMPNIEDYLSELVDLLAITDRRVARNATHQEVTIGSKNYSSTALRDAAEQIKQAIAEVIDTPAEIETHWNFIKAVHRPLRPGKNIDTQRVDYLILNYDTLIEDALALEKISYTDGMEGGVTGWWEPSKFANTRLKARVLKLHGSINWCQFPSETLPRRIPGNIEGAAIDEQHIVIWPASTKYRETQLDPYAQLASMARDVLRPKEGSQRVLVVCGYKFGDSHINLELDRALHESRDLTLVVFWSEIELEGILKAWNEDPAVQEQLLIYGKRGFWHGEVQETSTSDLPWWKFEIITRLLGGER